MKFSIKLFLWIRSGGTDDDDDDDDDYYYLRDLDPDPDILSREPSPGPRLYLVLLV